MLLSRCVTATLLLTSATSAAEGRKGRIIHRISQVAVVVAASSDAASSWGMREANPILRSHDGRFRTRGVVLKFGFTGAWLVIENCVFAKRNVKKATVANFAVTGVVAGVSVRNWRLER